jgi:hypothetical protein
MLQSPPDAAGKIVTVYVTFCVNVNACGYPPEELTNLNTKADAALLLIKQGWVRVDAGWLCPTCAHHAAVQERLRKSRLSVVAPVAIDTAASEPMAHLAQSRLPVS